MKQFLFIHPAGQGCALLFGLFNLISGLTKKGFNRIIHINCGLLYYFMVTLGIFPGIAATSWAVKQGAAMEMHFHAWTGAGIIMLFVVGGVTGFTLFRTNGVNKNLLSMHRWANVLSVMLFIVQLITGIKELVHL